MWTLLQASKFAAPLVKLTHEAEKDPSILETWWFWLIVIVIVVAMIACKKD